MPGGRIRPHTGSPIPACRRGVAAPAGSWGSRCRCSPPSAPERPAGTPSGRPSSFGLPWCGTCPGCRRWSPIWHRCRPRARRRRGRRDRPPKRPSGGAGIRRFRPRDRRKHHRRRHSNHAPARDSTRSRGPPVIRRPGRKVSEGSPARPPARSSRSGKEYVTIGVAASLERAYGAFRAGDLESAAEAYRAVVRHEPGNRDALLGLAAVATRAGGWDEAAGHYATAPCVPSRRHRCPSRADRHRGAGFGAWRESPEGALVEGAGGRASAFRSRQRLRRAIALARGPAIVFPARTASTARTPTTPTTSRSVSITSRGGRARSTSTMRRSPWPGAARRASTPRRCSRVFVKWARPPARTPPPVHSSSAPAGAGPVGGSR